VRVCVCVCACVRVCVFCVCVCVRAHVCFLEFIVGQATCTSKWMEELHIRTRMRTCLTLQCSAGGQLRRGLTGGLSLTTFFTHSSESAENESRHTYGWVVPLVRMGHIWMRHFTHVDEACHTYASHMSYHTYESHISHTCGWAVPHE